MDTIKRAVSAEPTISRREALGFGGGGFMLLAAGEYVLDFVRERERREDERREKEALTRPWQILIEQCHESLDRCRARLGGN